MFKQEDGAFAMGVCVEVEAVPGTPPVAKEISTEDDECGEGGDDDDGEFTRYGRIDSFPAAPFTGEWVIDGETYLANEQTVFEQEDGAFAVGVCVEVEAVPGTPPVAKEISTEDDECGEGGDDDDGEFTRYGRIDSFPAAPFTGEWVIDGETYLANEQTVLKQEDGAFAVGVCVEVEAVPGTPPVAKEISTEDDACGEGGDDDDEKEFTRYGRIDSFPAAPFTGEWVINGETYLANEQTVFEQAYGAFAVGVCVEVEAVPGTPPVAKEISTDEDYECGGRGDDDDDEAEGELYGIVTELPAGLVGRWVIGGKTFEATSDTEFDSNGGAFVVGVTVKVEFSADRAGGMRATEIELKYAADDDDDGKDGQAYGRIDSRPTGVAGQSDHRRHRLPGG